MLEDVQWTPYKHVFQCRKPNQLAFFPSFVILVFDDFAFSMRICYVMPSVPMKSLIFQPGNENPTLISCSQISALCKFFSVCIVKIINCFFAVIWWNHTQKRELMYRYNAFGNAASLFTSSIWVVFAHGAGFFRSDFSAADSNKKQKQKPRTVFFSSSPLNWRRSSLLARFFMSAKHMHFICTQSQYMT